MKPTIKILSLISIFSLVACEDVPEIENDDDIPVVEAFIYAGSIVEDIEVSRVLSYEDVEPEEQLEDVMPEIIWNNKTFTLGRDQTDGSYFYDGSDLSISSCETYELQFMYNGKLIQASTIVPPKPQDVSLSKTSVFLPQLETIFDVRDLVANQNNNIDVQWDNPSSDYYFLVIENIEDDPQPIDIDNILNFNFEFISSPIQDSFFTLVPLVHFNQFGVHRIVVYRVNEEYALLYETRVQDSNNLSEVFTNVDNGVGIFSGFASDTVFLEVIKQ